MRIAAFLVGLVAALASVVAVRADEATIAFDLPFALVDGNGRTVTGDDFAGRWLLIYFGYTNCADFCPTSLSAIAEAMDELGPAARHVQPLFVTVDPERDKGKVLETYPASFDRRILGLGGDERAIARLAGALGVKYEKVLTGDDDYVVDHSTTLTLIDPARHNATTFAMAEPYQIAARLFAVLERAGVRLDDVNNLGAYR